MSYNKILTIQDISCVGQCSLTVALPILSACGQETAILPSAVLSTHTAGFKGKFTFHDLTDEIPAIVKHWVDADIRFDAIYTGYLGSTRQIEMVKDTMKTVGNVGCKKIVDPAMADNGKLYVGFDQAYVEAMKSLCVYADMILPNITEACFITNSQYKESYDEAYIDELLKKMTDMGCKTIILTGVSYRPEKTGVVVFENGKKSYYEHKKISKGSHGTGDVYSSAFVGALMNGKTTYEAARIAADYTVICIENTYQDESHWYGPKFEPQLSQLINLLNE